jgi:hypothetical protein
LLKIRVRLAQEAEALAGNLQKTFALNDGSRQYFRTAIRFPVPGFSGAALTVTAFTTLPPFPVPMPVLFAFSAMPVSPPLALAFAEGWVPGPPVISRAIPMLRTSSAASSLRGGSFGRRA